MHLTWFTRQYFHCCFCVFGVKPPFVKKCLIEETMTKVKAAKHSHVFTAIVACHRCVGQIMRCYTVHLLGVSVPNIFSQNPYFLKIHSNNCGFLKKWWMHPRAEAEVYAGKSIERWLNMFCSKCVWTHWCFGRPARITQAASFEQEKHIDASKWEPPSPIPLHSALVYSCWKVRMSKYFPINFFWSVPNHSTKCREVHWWFSWNFLMCCFNRTLMCKLNSLFGLLLWTGEA